MVRLILFLILFSSPVYSQEGGPKPNEDKIYQTDNRNERANNLSHQAVPFPLWNLDNPPLPIVNLSSAEYTTEHEQCSPGKNWKEWFAFALCEGRSWDVESIIAIFTGMLVIATFLLWRATVKLVKDARLAAVQQAGDMRESLKIGRGTERPHVFVFRTIKDRSKSGRIIKLNGINLRNIGRTPAFVSHFSIEVGVFQKPPLPLDLVPKPYPTSAIVVPGENWPFQGATPKGITDEQLQIGERFGSPEKLFVYGLMIYADYDGTRYCCWFCRIYANGSFAFDPTGTPELERIEYNGSGRIVPNGKTKRPSFALKNGLVAEPEVFWYNGPRA